MAHQLTPEIANRFAEIALGHVTKEYPHKLDHVLDGPEDVLGPRQLHPIFFGSFDWHSCVHGYWLLLTTRRLFPDLQVATRVKVLLDEMLTAEKVAGELTYLDRAYTGGFERPYGWAWLLALHREAQRHGDDEWAVILAPLAEAFADRFKIYLPKLDLPDPGRHPFQQRLRDDPRARMGGGEQFRPCRPDPRPGAGLFRGGSRLPGLGAGRRRVSLLGADRGAADAADTAETRLRALVRRFPARSRRPQAGDPVHTGFRLRSLGRQDRPSRRGEFSRAWCWRGVSGALAPDLAALAGAAANAHLDASLPHVAGDYAGEHWLATFALLALLQGD